MPHRLRALRLRTQPGGAGERAIDLYLSARYRPLVVADDVGIRSDRRRQESCRPGGRPKQHAAHRHGAVAWRTHAWAKARCRTRCRWAPPNPIPSTASTAAHSTCRGNLKAARCAGPACPMARCRAYFETSGSKPHLRKIGRAAALVMNARYRVACAPAWRVSATGYTIGAWLSAGNTPTIRTPFSTRASVR